MAGDEIVRTDENSSAPGPFERVHLEYQSRQRSVLGLLGFAESNASMLSDHRLFTISELRVKHRSHSNELFERVIDLLEVLNRHSSDGQGGDEYAVGPEVISAIEACEACAPDGYDIGPILGDALRASLAKPPLPVLVSSLLVTLVGNFEMLVSNLLSLAYERHPEHVEAGDRRFTWKELNSADSITGLRQEVIEQTIRKLLFQSFDEWMKHIATRLGCNAPARMRDHSVREIFQRRNCVVHNDGKASLLYIRAMPEHAEVTEGADLDVDAPYLRGAAQRLDLLAMFLTLELGRQEGTFEEIERIESYSSNLAFEALRDGRFELAQEMTEHLQTARLRTEFARQQARVNYWLACKKLGTLDSCLGDLQGWDTSAASPLFAMAKAALLDDHEGALRLMTELMATGSLSVGDAQNWPLLDEVRLFEARKRGAS